MRQAAEQMAKVKGASRPITRPEPYFPQPSIPQMRQAAEQMAKLKGAGGAAARHSVVKHDKHEKH